MTDIFQEVEEEVRRERAEQLWKEYGDYVIAAIALIIIGVAGYVLWSRYEDNQRLKASDTLSAAQQLADTGDSARAGQALGAVVKDAPHGYALMARLSEAGVLLSSGKRDEAVTIYKTIAAEDRGPIGSVALIRAGWAEVETAPRKDIEDLLKPLDTPTNPWRFEAREVLAYAAYHAGDAAGARAAFDALAKDKGAPDGMRQRSAALAAFIKSGGLANYGTVPPPPKPETPPAGAAPAPGAPPAPTSPAPAAPAAPNGGPK